MSRRILLAGGAPESRERITSAIDAAFDADVDAHDEPAGAIRVLPNRAYDLAIVLARGVPIPGLDLVRFLRHHALHAHVPVVFVGGEPPERQAALALGARLFPDDASPADVRRIVREALGIE